MNGVAALADDFFRLAHDDLSGRPRLPNRVLGLGLASALLAELMFGRQLTVHEGRLWLLEGPPPADALGHTTMETIHAEPAHREVRTWLDYLAHTTPTDVAQRLLRAGHLREESTRRLLGRTELSYVPTNINRAAWPASRLAVALGKRGPLSYGDSYLAGLVSVTGLSGAVLDGAAPSTHDYLRRLLAGTPTPLAELRHETGAAVGDAVLAYRT